MDLKQVKSLKSCIDMCLKVIRMYDWLLDLFVLDFFVDNHWDKLPDSWSNAFQDMDPQDLGNILAGQSTNHMLPLSFLALMKTVRSLSIARINNSFQCRNNLNCDQDSCAGHPRLKNLFLKHVKLKKRHEIILMADVVKEVAILSNCDAVIDFGSGLGHLVRVLAYKKELYAAGIECQAQLTEEARNKDLELEYTASKHLSRDGMSKLRRPTHFNIKLSSHNQLLDLPLPKTMSAYGLVGLHPCGDLGPLLLSHFVENDSVKFIALVGCCFMKLTSKGYPISDYVKDSESHLSYVSREISCHAIEVYCERLREGNYENLKVHAYRAALERILLDHNPNLKHAPVGSIKHSDTMTFDKYCTLALERLKIPLPVCPGVWSRGRADLLHWRRVVIMYTLRLALAPLVETVILLDRVLYVLQNGISCQIHPVFDPKISPRNHIIIARR